MAVQDINFEVLEGEAFGFLGPNGAGKTTTMRMIQCVSPKTSGSLKVFGMDVDTNPREIKQFIGVVPQENNLDLDFTTIENLIRYATYFDIPQHEAIERAEELLKFMQLTEKSNVPIDKLSGGMKRRLILARALINNPRLLILDEPTTGLDPQARHLIWEKLRGLLVVGNTIVLTTHYMDEAAQLCDRIVVMDQGKILVTGKPDQLVREYTGNHIVETEKNEEVITCLTKHSVPYDVAGEKVQIFTQDPKEITRMLLDECAIGHVSARQTTLEDVFLKLTGRTLRE